jgi:hypothetical protein
VLHHYRDQNQITANGLKSEPLRRPEHTIVRPWRFGERLYGTAAKFTMGLLESLLQLLQTILCGSGKPNEGHQQQPQPAWQKPPGASHQYPPPQHHPSLPAQHHPKPPAHSHPSKPHHARIDDVSNPNPFWATLSTETTSNCRMHRHKQIHTTSSCGHEPERKEMLWLELSMHRKTHIRVAIELGLKNFRMRAKNTRLKWSV